MGVLNCEHPLPGVDTGRWVRSDGYVVRVLSATDDVGDIELAEVEAAVGSTVVRAWARLRARQQGAEDRMGRETARR